MTCSLVAVSVDAQDPAGVARFWAGLLGGEPVDNPGGGVLLAPEQDLGFRLRFVPTALPKTVKNHAHPDLRSDTAQEQDDTVARALELGARHIDVGQRPEDGQVVLADPEGNELCVIEAGNGFLADCPRFGALACDGSETVGRFWAQVLDWPLVWDQDTETAIRSPQGGPKISWGGYLSTGPRTGPYRWRFEVAPAAGGDQQAEVERLLALGATRTDTWQPGPDAVALADPDGHEFSVLAGP